jgi:hypothetical protein
MQINSNMAILHYGQKPSYQSPFTIISFKDHSSHPLFTSKDHTDALNTCPSEPSVLAPKPVKRFHSQQFHKTRTIQDKDAPIRMNVKSHGLVTTVIFRQITSELYLKFQTKPITQAN